MAEHGAGRLERAAGQLARGEKLSGSSRSTIRKYERATGAGNGTAANMTASAATLRGTVAALRDDGSQGYWATGNTTAQFVAGGFSADALAHATVGGKTVNVNLGHSSFMDAGILRWAVGHEPMHNMGLRDLRLKGITAYRFGSPAQESAFKLFPKADPSRARINPDNLLDFVQ